MAILSHQNLQTRAIRAWSERLKGLKYLAENLWYQANFWLDEEGSMVAKGELNMRHDLSLSG